MNHLTKITFGLFVLTLPACGYTVMPAILSCIVFLSLYAEQQFVVYQQGVDNEKLVKDVEKLKSQMADLQFRAR